LATLLLLLLTIMMMMTMTLLTLPPPSIRPLARLHSHARRGWLAWRCRLHPQSRRRNFLRAMLKLLRTFRRTTTARQMQDWRPALLLLLFLLPLLRAAAAATMTMVN
jgi:hypothetical protein